MTSLTRRVVPSALSFIAAGTLWRGAFVVAAIAAVVVARGCGYELGVLGRYGAYMALHVVLPGVVALYFVNRGPLSFATTIALAIPTGFALEIFTFLGAAAVEAKNIYSWIPLAWLAAAVAIRMRRGAWPIRVRLSANHAGICLGLAVAFLATSLMAASQMFAESPLAAGLPTRAIFHDWVYLVSRAAVIKHNWPLDDPSLSGTPLQYHYFMMVHAAAVSWTTGVEITTVMLRLLYVPLGAALVAQTYLLARLVSRSAWGGVIAALLVVIASEVSFAPSYGDPMFLGLFVRWLFVSPTFFFGMIFCGALLLAVVRCVRLTRSELRHYLWLLLLATAGTGAKGTVLPVLIVALGLWTGWRWLHERALPWRPIVIGAIFVFAFAVVYIPTMWGWRTGDAAWRPFHVFQLTQFWKQYLPQWQAALAAWLPMTFAEPLAKIACGAVVFAGTCGVRLLALPYLLAGDLERRDRMLVGWIGAFFFASTGMGLMMELNSYGELYLVLMMRVPMAVLAAAFLVTMARRLARWWQGTGLEAGPRAPSNAVPMPRLALEGRESRAHRALVVVASVVLVGAFAMQTSLWWARNRTGLREWLGTPANLQPDESMRALQEALLWVRDSTEANAVLVANACTPENMKKDHWGALDGTLTGVHFYYSALSERRLWFEGPNYIMDTTSARIRAGLASGFFYRGNPLRASDVARDDPCYVLVDRSIHDGAKVGAATGPRVFANSRMEVYRITMSDTMD